MPEIKPVKELRFRSPNGKLAIRSQLLRPATNSDFVATQGAGQRRDVGFFPIGTASSGAGIGINAFYVSAVVQDFATGDNLFINNSAGKDVLIVHLDGPTTVS